VQSPLEHETLVFADEEDHPIARGLDMEVRFEAKDSIHLDYTLS
jgi:hypothetical protein